MHTFKKKLLLLGATVIFVQLSAAYGQQNFLKIGDKIPNIKVNLINYPTKSAEINDFKGKLLILDFWATWCSPCVAYIPKMDSIQSIFRDKVQILPISDEPFEKISQFSQHLFKATNIKLISAYNESRLESLFDFNAIPFYVWINPEGTIIALTSAEEVTIQNINKILISQQTNVTSKKQIKKTIIDQKKAIFNLHYNELLTDNSILPHMVDTNIILGQSIGTGFIPGLPIGRTTNDSLHYFSTNTSISRIYAHLYSMIYYGYTNLGIQSEARTVFEISNSQMLERLKNDLYGSAYEKFLEANGACYEIVWPKGIVFGDYKTKFNLIKSDLDRYFGIPNGFDTKIEKREVKQCLVLEKTSKQNILESKGEKPEESFDRYNYKITNMPFSSFFNRLSGYYFQLSEMPILDRTGIHDNIDLELKCNMTDLKQLNSELEKYGLVLRNKPEIADVLVFYER
jgi:thiol-disulfide isomerase/thioredoxin